MFLRAIHGQWDINPTQLQGTEDLLELASCSEDPLGYSDWRFINGDSMGLSDD